MKLKAIIILLVAAIAVQAQHFTHAIDPNIRTLRMRYLSQAIDATNIVARPFLILDEKGVIDGSEPENCIEISFDYLSHDTKQYTYRVLHCDKNWQASQINSYEYLDGFTTNDIVDYELSVNTQQEYTHYWLEFPNEDMHLTASGNYVLQVYQDGDPENVVAEACFSVVEPIVGIDAKLRANTDIELNGRYQQLDIDLQTNALDLRDAQDVTVIVTQNGRRDNRVTLDKPSFVEPNRLRYINQKTLIFEGGNEYRHFDMYSTYYAGYNVNRVVYQQGEYHALLETDELRGTMSKGAGREGQVFLSEQDANGQWVVNCEKTDYVDTEAEYMWVHFVLPVTTPIMDGYVFVGGDLFYNQYTADNMMMYDAEEKCYYARAYLKQGGYNYLYYVGRTTGGAHQSANWQMTLLPLEGSHWQTENEYTIDVYYRPFGARYDRLVGRKRE